MFAVQVVDVAMLPLTRISAAIALWAIIDEPITSANVLPTVLIFISWSFFLKDGAETDWTMARGVRPRFQTPRCDDGAFCHSFADMAYLLREPFVQIASGLFKSLFRSEIDAWIRCIDFASFTNAEQLWGRSRGCDQRLPLAARSTCSIRRATSSRGLIDCASRSSASASSNRLWPTYTCAIFTFALAANDSMRAARS